MRNQQVRENPPPWISAFSQQVAISLHSPPRKQAPHSVSRRLHYSEEYEQNYPVEGLQPQGSSSHFKKYTHLNDVWVRSGFSRHPSGQCKKRLFVYHAILH
jgi:hypothetical protein